MGLQACCIPMVILTGLSVMYAMFMGDPSSGSPQGRFTFFVTCWLPHHFNIVAVSAITKNLATFANHTVVVGCHG